MPAPLSITLSGISWSTPDGHPVLEGIDLAFDVERTGLIGRNGVGKTTLFKLITGEIILQGGALAVRGTLGVLRQSVQVRSDETIADLFGVRAALDLLDRAERGEASADELAEADWTLEARLESILERTGLSIGPDTPLTTLSGGQRTRAALAALIFAEPDFLLLDEPTNNLDREGRRAVVELLAAWRAGAIVISHDRELLDTMDAIVELTALGATRYGGNWSHYRERKSAELAAAQRGLADAEKRNEAVARSAQRTAERKARRDGAGQRKRARGDLAPIYLDKLKAQSEGTTGANARLAERRHAEAAQALDEARKQIEVLTPFSVSLASTNLPAGKTVLRLDRVTAGYDPARPIIDDFSLEIRGPERVAITGPNGSGKTTLLRGIAGQLPPLSGSAEVSVPFAMLDQRISLLDPRISIRDNYRRINPDEDENACRAALARFMFRADAAMQRVESLSGGQLLRAGLACVLGTGKPPQLLILDEPTNHLDIESIETVEAGLRAYDGALLVVSHDEAFLEAVGIERRVEL
ncbi:ABC-F family ATP-binding cassette domain-containing protein [Pelagibacterium sediminicola]|uniref:ABC-F family ATP-binding cassette domain-containing protein n=1 Tax=Pelagibacterium sediminicola TaxID=2248761 RepID=UPI000E30EAB8|nr:ABC-F family ATP-binding cassette domain-containing protein [Pelagibacterium sediminicola]